MESKPCYKLLVALAAASLALLLPAQVPLPPMHAIRPASIDLRLFGPWTQPEPVTPPVLYFMVKPGVNFVSFSDRVDGVWTNWFTIINRDTNQQRVAIVVSEGYTNSPAQFFRVRGYGR